MPVPKGACSLGQYRPPEVLSIVGDIAQTAAHHAVGSPPQMDSCMLAGKLVHVVDDDYDFLQGVRRLLVAHGLRVETFSSPEAYQREADPYEAVCLILDIHLGRVSGIEFLGQLSQSGVSTPVVFMSADDRDQTRRAALDAGCTAFLQKPFSGTMLMEAVQQAADRASTHH